MTTLGSHWEETFQLLKQTAAVRDVVMQLVQRWKFRFTDWGGGGTMFFSSPCFRFTEGKGQSFFFGLFLKYNFDKSMIESY